MRLFEFKTRTAVFLGTSVNCFAFGGKSVCKELPYKTIEEFIRNSKNFKTITEQQFEQHAGIIDPNVDYAITRNRRYLYDTSSRLFIVQDLEMDIYFFFSASR